MNRNAVFPLVAATIALAVLVAGCTGTGTPQTLENTAWTLVTIRDDTGNLVPVLAGTGVTAEFSADGRVTGSAGCNRYFAGYSVSGNSIAIGDVGSTKIFCGEPEGLMVQESRYLGHLASATSFRIDGTTLTLLGGDGRPSLVFRQGPR